MKKLMVLLLLALACPVIVWADCLAMPDQCVGAYAAKKKAMVARDKGDYVAAAREYQKAADLMPMELYKAFYLLNAEGCLVGVWNPAKGYRIDAAKAATVKGDAQALLDQVKGFLKTALACNDENGQLEKAQSWLNNAQDALNGIFH